MAAQEYTIKSWQAWMDRETDEPIRDPHGNYKGTVTFDEYTAQPVDATFKQQPTVGDKKYGEIVDYKSKAGNARLKFQRADRPQPVPVTQMGTATSKRDYQPRDDNAIRAQWALGQVYSKHAPSVQGDHPDWNLILTDAKRLYAMVDEVKSSTDHTANVSKVIPGATNASIEQPVDSRFGEDLVHEPTDAELNATLNN